MFATAVLAADYAGTLELSDRTELRARSTQQLSAVDQPAPSGTTALGIDFFNQPLARLRVFDRTWDWRATYTPSLILPDLEFLNQGLSPLLFHVGGVSVSWHDRFARLTLGEDGVYGQQNSAYLLPAQAVPGQPPSQQPIAQPTTIEYGSTRTYLNATDRIDRQGVLGLGVEYLWRGGTDATSRTIIPDQSGVLAQATLDYDVARTDRLTTLVSFQSAEFTALPCNSIAAATPVVPTGPSCSPQNFISLAEETLTHKTSRIAALSLGAGGAVVTDRQSRETAYGTYFAPVADASYQVRLGHEETSQFQIFARLAPYVNMLFGIVTNNLIGEASLRDQLTERVSFRVAVGAAQTLPTDAEAATGLVHSDLELDYRASPSVDLAVGERAFWQQLSGVGAFVSTFGFLGVTVHPPTLRL